MILHKNNNQGVFLELLVVAKTANTTDFGDLPEYLAHLFGRQNPIVKKRTNGLNKYEFNIKM